MRYGSVSVKVWRGDEGMLLQCGRVGVKVRRGDGGMPPKCGSHSYL